MLAPGSGHGWVSRPCRGDRRLRCWSGPILMTSAPYIGGHQHNTMVAPLRAGRLTDCSPPAVDLPGRFAHRVSAASPPETNGIAPAGFGARRRAVYNHRSAWLWPLRGTPFSSAARQITAAGGHLIVFTLQ